MILKKLLKNKTKILIVFLLVCIIAFISNYGIVRIENNNGGFVDITIYRNNQEIKKVNKLTSSKFLVLKKGDLAIEAQKDEKSSIYRSSLGSFGYLKHSLIFKDHLELSLVGQSKRDCFDVNSNLFFTCYSEESPLLEDQKNYTSEEVDIGLPPNNIIKKSNAGLYRFSLNNQVLSINRVINNVNGDELFSIPYEHFLDHNLVAVSKSGKWIAIFDPILTTIHVYNNETDEKKSIGLKNDFEATDGHLQNIAISDSAAFLINRFTPDKGLGDDDAGAETIRNQYFLEVDLRDNKISKTSIDSGVLFSSFSVSDNNTMLVSDFVNTDGSFYLLTKNKGLKKLFPVVSRTSDFCWENNDEFLYVDHSEDKIYKHSINNKTSYLVYQGKDVNNIKLDCSQNTKTISLIKDIDDDRNYLHFILTNNPRSGAKIEDIMPIYLNSNNGVVRVEAYRDVLKIVFIYIDPSATNVDSEYSRLSESLLKTLNQEKINQNKYRIIY